MERQEIIQALMQNMETVGRAAASRGFGHFGAGEPTHAQIGIMLVLLHQGPQNIKSLADQFRMTSSAATQLVNGLVRDGLLARAENKRDRRQISVELTVKGKRVLIATKKRRLESMIKIFETLSDTELSQLEKIQRKLVEQLQILWTKKQQS